MNDDMETDEKFCCKLCLKGYSSPRESRRNLLKNPKIIDNLRDIGLEFVNISERDTICLKCSRNIGYVMEKDKIREEWIRNNLCKRKRKAFELEIDATQEVYENENGQDTLKKIGEICRAEVAKLTKTTLAETSVDAITSIDENVLCLELDKVCPVLSAALNGAMGVDEENNKIGPKATCYGLVYKARYPTNKGCLIAHRNDQILMAAGAKKKSFKWFNKLGITNSFQTALNKNKALADNHDEVVKGWKKLIEEMGMGGPEYGIIGDNLDFVLTTRSQGTKQSNKTFNWFNFMAVKDRLLSFQDNKQKEEYESMSILPNESDIQETLENFKFLITKSVVKFIPAFKSFQNVVQKHLDHPFKEEMAKKSEVVPLGLIFRSENSSSEMNTIMQTIQSQYVPTFISEDGVIEVKESIPFGGDQLTEERAVGVQRAMSDGETKYERLEGLTPKFEDWHLKRTLYVVKDKMFRVEESGREPGSTQWSMNVLQCSNAKKGPHDAFNAYSEFNDKELDGQIVALVMTSFGMENIEDDPIPTNIKNGSNEEKLGWLHSIVDNIVKEYVVHYDESISNVRKNTEKAKRRDTFKLTIYYCSKVATGECKHGPFKLEKARNKHEKKKHAYDRQTLDKDTCQESNNNVKDNIKEYQSALFTLNLYLRNINDAIREGDGARLIRTYKFALLYFKATNHTKYSYSIVKLLCRIKFQPEWAFKLIWCRFINTCGYPGRNISLDLHLEHLNHFLKELLKGTRNNLTESNASRISKSLNNVMKIVNNLETSLHVKNAKGNRKTPDTFEDIKLLATSLVNENVFKSTPGRQYENFPNFKKCIFDKIDIEQFGTWLRSKESEFKDLYKDISL